MVIGAMMALEEVTDDYEVVVIDDGSSDASRAMLRRLEADYPRFRAVFHEKNRGYGGALRSGFASATKEFIFYTDGDAQYDVRELTKLVKRLDEDPSADVVQGYKIKRHDPWYRILIGKAYQHMMKRMFGLRITDVDCDFRLIRRSVFDRVKLDRDTGVICLEMVKKIQDAGFRFTEVPVNHFFRAYGSSQFFNVRRVFKVGRGVLELWWELVLEPRFGRGKPGKEALAPEPRSTEPPPPPEEAAPVKRRRKAPSVARPSKSSTGTGRRASGTKKAGAGKE
jgi:glycosyltransferase involved in cell wall biosynthesis